MGPGGQMFIHKKVRRSETLCLVRACQKLSLTHLISSPAIASCPWDFLQRRSFVDKPLGSFGISTTHLEITGQYMCNTVSQCYSITVSQCYSVTVSQCYSVTVSQCYSVTVLQRHSVTVLQCHSITVSQCCGVSVTVSQCYSITVSQYHSVTVPQCHSVAVS